MTGNVSSEPHAIYKGIKGTTVYASADTDDQKGVINSQEAKNKCGNIFDSANDQSVIDDAIKGTRLKGKDNTTVTGLIKKYLAGISFENFFKGWDAFGNINYKVIDIEDSENESDVQQQIDAKVDPEIKKRANTILNQAIETYKNKINDIIGQVENELLGDADIMEDGKVKGKDDSFSLDKIKYQRSFKNGENTNVATFASNTKGAEQTKGYSNTVAYLKANGAKDDEGIVNGVKQKVYEVKVDGKKRYVTVDDAGQVHELIGGKGFLSLGKGKYTTKDSIEDAKYQANNDGTNNTDNDIPRRRDVKVKVRKVDGQEQSVMTWKDRNGKKHSRVIDHNDKTGLTTSADVHQVNAGGRAKYASDTSGLGAYVKDPGDQRYFDDKKHKVHTEEFASKDGTFYLNTEGKRMKIDAKNIAQAITNITAELAKLGINPDENTNNKCKFVINGQPYVIDKTDNKAADKTMRLIQGEIDRIQRNKGSIPEITPLEDITVDLSGIVEDNRIGANIKRNGTTQITLENGSTVEINEQWTSGETVEGAGVDHKTHLSNEDGKGKVNTIKYDKTVLSKAQFAKEGWGTDSARTKENTYLEKMNVIATRNGEKKSARNIKTAHEFAAKFIDAYIELHTEYKGYNYDVKKLADAIKVANPSWFDAAGNMYKDVDPSRLNLPTDISSYMMSTASLPPEQSGFNASQGDGVINSVNLDNQPNNEPVVHEKKPVPQEKAVKQQGKPVVRDRGLNDNEIEQYLAADDYFQSYKRALDEDKNQKSKMDSDIIQRGGDPSDPYSAMKLGGFDYNCLRTDIDTREREFESYKKTLKNWIDGPTNGQSKSIDGTVLTDIKKETLPDGTKVYNTKFGYYSLYINGKPGKKMNEEELKKHGWVKP